MKKEHAYLLMGISFLIGIGLGVVITVLHEERLGLPTVSRMAEFSPEMIPQELNEKISALEALVEKDPKNLQALIELGNLYFDLGRVESAIDRYSTVLAIQPENADVRTDRGILYRRKGEIERAIADFKKAAQDDPRHINSRYNLGVILLHDKGDLKGAIEAWEDYLKVNPHSPRAENIRIQLSKMKVMAK